MFRDQDVRVALLGWCHQARCLNVLRVTSPYPQVAEVVVYEHAITNDPERFIR